MVMARNTATDMGSRKAKEEKALLPEII